MKRTDEEVHEKIEELAEWSCEEITLFTSEGKEVYLPIYTLN